MILKLALRSNAIFSLVTGLLLTVASAQTADLFGVRLSWPFLTLGVSLLFFAVVVFLVSSQQPIHALYSFLISIMDFMWVLASVFIIVLDPYGISDTGNLLIAAVAFAVLCFAIAQSYGITKLDLNASTGRKELRFEREVPFHKREVWDLISDVGNYHHVAPNIDNVDIVSGDKQGMVRKCSKDKGSWTEKCIKWMEGEEFSFKVNTSAPDYPFPLRFLKGTWSVESLSSSESRIKMLFEFEYKKNVFNLLLHPLMAPNFRGIAEKLLDNWEMKLKSEG